MMPGSKGKKMGPDIPDVNNDGVGDKEDLKLIRIMSSDATGYGISHRRTDDKKYSAGGEVKGYAPGGLVENSCRGGRSAIAGTKFRGVK